MAKTYRPGRGRYRISKSPCRQKRSGKKGKYIMSFRDYYGEERKACHTSLKKAKRQIRKIQRWLKSRAKNEQVLREFVSKILVETST